MPVLTPPDAPTHDLGGTRFTPLVSPSRGATETAVWWTEIEPGTPATPHALTREEVFVVVAGAAAVQLGDERTIARTGDAIVVPIGVDLAIECASTTAVRLLCCLPVGGQAALADGTTFTPPWAL